MKNTLSTFEIAKLMHWSPRAVANWIDQGSLKAGRTPGGHRRVQVEDLIDFLKRQNLAIPEKLLSPAPRVLIVDDDEAVTKWIARAILSRHSDYQIRQATSGFEAGAVISTWVPDVVILDLLMPTIDGYEVCRQVKTRRNTKDIIVIAITGAYSQVADEKIRSCGAVACLPKPLDINDLTRVIEASLDSTCDEPEEKDEQTWGRQPV